MTSRIIKECKAFIEMHEYEKCEVIIVKAMEEEPHSAVPHNLMGVLLEKEQNHPLAMKHFRAAYGLDPTYAPARYNLDTMGSMYRSNLFAFEEEDCREERG